MLTIPGVPHLKRAESHFFSKHAALLDITLRVSDVAVITLVALAVYRLEFGTFHMDTGYTSGLLRTVLLALVVFPAAGLYRSWRGENRLREIVRLWGAWMGVMCVLLAIGWALKTTDHYSRVVAGSWFLCTGVLLTFDRLVLRWVLGRVRANGLDSRRVLLVGGTQAAQRIVAASRRNAWAGLDIVGYVRTPYDQVEVQGIPCLGDFDEFAAKFDSWEPDQVWVALPMRAESMIQQVLHLTFDKPSTIRLVPDFFGYELINHHAAVLGGVPVITLRASRVAGHSHIMKGMMDRTISAVLLLMISPVLLMLAIGVKLSSPGPVFYRQRRVGMDGKEFDMLKFRSMPVDVERHGVKWGSAGNKTNTRFGRFIRATSLDELPQFLNVLRGELSIVGPRPERPVFVHEFKHTIPGYMHKHFVKGGITGWAQIPLMLFWLGIAPAMRDMAWRWMLPFLGVAVLVCASKLVFMAWGLGIRRLDFIGISGHSAMAAVVWPSLFGLMAGHCSPRWRRLAVACGMGLALLVAVSRLMLHIHSVAEVIAGFILGASAASLFLVRFGARWQVADRRPWLMLSVLVVLPFIYGHRFPSERILRAVAQKLSLQDTAYTRRYFLEHPG